MIAAAISSAAFLCSGPGLAQAAPSSGFRPEYRLTEQEKEQILTAAEANANTRFADSRLEPIDVTKPPPISGEVGFSIGTDGSRSAFGSAFYPFGNAGGAMISIDMDRFGRIPQPLIVANPNR